MIVRSWRVHTAVEYGCMLYVSSLVFLVSCVGYCCRAVAAGVVNLLNQSINQSINQVDWLRPPHQAVPSRPTSRVLGRARGKVGGACGPRGPEGYGPRVPRPLRGNVEPGLRPAWVLRDPHGISERLRGWPGGLVEGGHPQ